MPSNLFLRFSGSSGSALLAPDLIARTSKQKQEDMTIAKFQLQENETLIGSGSLIYHKVEDKFHNTPRIEIFT